MQRLLPFNEILQQTAQWTVIATVLSYRGIWNDGN